MQPAPHHSTHHSAPLASDVSASAAIQAQLAQAQLLLAETRLHCQGLLDAAQSEAAEIIANGRAIAQRVVADARSQTTHVDVRERSSSMFSDLWSELGEEHDPDAFFDGFTARQAEDIFER